MPNLQATDAVCSLYANGLLTVYIGTDRRGASPLTAGLFQSLIRRARSLRPIGPATLRIDGRRAELCCRVEYGPAPDASEEAMMRAVRVAFHDLTPEVSDVRVHALLNFD